MSRAKFRVSRDMQSGSFINKPYDTIEEATENALIVLRHEYPGTKMLNIVKVERVGVVDSDVTFQKRETIK